MEENKEKGFTIKDRRAFTKDGDKKPASDEADAVKTGAGDNAEATHQDTPNENVPPPPLPELNFSAFIISISSSALFHFGEIPDPVTNQAQKNLPMAKQTIDILGILKEKTAGNLSDEEDKLLDNLLYDLRMRYVQETQPTK